MPTVDAMDVEDAREVCVEEGLQVSSDMTLPTLRRMLRLHFGNSARHGNMTSPLQRARSSSSSSGARTPSSSLAGIAESAMSAELAEYYEMIDSMDNLDDAIMICQEENAAIPPNATLPDLKRVLKAHFSAQVAGTTVATADAPPFETKPDAPLLDTTPKPEPEPALEPEPEDPEEPQPEDPESQPARRPPPPPQPAAQSAASAPEPAPAPELKPRPKPKPPPPKPQPKVRTKLPPRPPAPQISRQSVPAWFEQAEKENPGSEAIDGLSGCCTKEPEDELAIDVSEFWSAADRKRPKAPYSGETYALSLKPVPGLGFGIVFKEYLDCPVITSFKPMANGKPPPAAVGGAAIGSILLEVDGAPVTNTAEIVAAVQAAAGSEGVVFGFFTPHYVHNAQQGFCFDAKAELDIASPSFRFVEHPCDPATDASGGDAGMFSAASSVLGNAELRGATARIAKAQTAGVPPDPSDVMLLVSNKDAQKVAMTAANNSAVRDAATSSMGLPAGSIPASRTDAPAEKQSYRPITRSLRLPVWQHPAFLDALADSSEPASARSMSCPPGMANLAASTDLMANVLQQLCRESPTCPSLDRACKTFAASMPFMLDFPAYGSDSQLFCEYILRVKGHVSSMDNGESVVLPCGWCRRKKGVAENFAFPMVLHKRPDSTFALAACNTGEGSEYYPVSPQEWTGELRRAQSMAFYKIEKDMISSSSFWFVLMRMLVYPSKQNGPKDIYERLLPGLSRKPLLKNQIGNGAEFPSIPASGDTSHWKSIVEAMRWTLIWGGASPVQASYVGVMSHWTLLQWVTGDLKGAQIDDVDAALIRESCKQLAKEAYFAAKQADCPFSSAELHGIRDSVETLRNRVCGFVDSSAPPVLAIPRKVPACHADHVDFGRFRRDVSLEQLAGGAPDPPIQLPVELTRMPDSVNNNRDAASAMRTCVKLCTLLDNQAAMVKNSYLHRAAMIQHLFTRVIPLPLPHNHPERNQRCFWHAQPLRYADQADILRSLEMLCRHYTCVALSLKATSSFDATRLLVMACIVGVADAVMRISACDDPSDLSQHYAGTAKGPVKPFGFKMGHYAEESETGRFTNPELTTARTQILDYFHQQEEFLTPERTIFGFEVSMDFGEGERNLMTQLCLATGFARTQRPDGERDDTLPRYLCYEDRELIDSFPELAFFRDIVYCCKALSVPTSDALPEMKKWRPTDAALRWEHKGKGFMAVFGFNRELKCAAFQTPGEDSRTWYQKMYKEKPRKAPSAADPSNLADGDVQTEDDVLHVRHLPDFDGKIQGRYSELLLQYLTVPYLRIPLVMKFFSDHMRITALGSEELQQVIDACLFEPGKWQEDYEKKIPELVPCPEGNHLSTPCGLLFNELAHSPGQLMQALQDMAKFILEMDEGKFSWHSSPYILYLLRLFVRIEEYLQFMDDHVIWKRDANLFSATGARSFVRGLQCSDASLVIVKDALKMTRQTLNNDLYPLLSAWCKKSTRDKQMKECAILHTHLAYIFKNVTSKDLDARAVETLLISQMYLHNSFTFDMDDLGSSDEKRTGQEENLNSGLGVPQTEVFDLFTKHRNKCMAWLLASPTECNKVMDNVECALAMTEQVDEAAEEQGPVHRRWLSLSEPGLVGRFQPEIEIRARQKLPSLEFSCFEDWIRYTSTQAVETEINIQLGTFTMKKQAMHVLPSAIARDRDFMEIFGSSAAEFGMQCADVKLAANLDWLRLIGRHHDVFWWKPDGQKPDTSETRSYPQNLMSGESWVRSLLDPVLQQYQLSARLSLQMSDASNANSAKLSGYFLPEADAEGIAINQDELLHEIVVFREPPVVHIYNVLECGRRWFRELIYSSSHNSSFCDLPPNYDDKTGPHTCSAGRFDDDRDLRRPPVHTVTLTRNLSISIGVQTYIPARFLRGVIPDALIEDYQFWQGELRLC